MRIIHIMRNQVLKYAFIFVAFAALVSIIVANGCSNTNPPSTPPPAEGSQQPSQPPSGMPARPGSDAVERSILTKVADKLGIPVDTLTKAYYDAKSTTVPPAPPGVEVPIAPGASLMKAVFEKMSKTLSIPADNISTAWQQATSELSAPGGPQK